MFSKPRAHVPALRRDDGRLRRRRAQRTAAARRAPAQPAGPGYSVETGRRRPKADSGPGGAPDGAVTASCCMSGAGVVRGRDWCWPDDDGGAGRPGVMEDGPAPAGWCLVSAYAQREGRTHLGGEGGLHRPVHGLKRAPVWLPRPHSISLAEFDRARSVRLHAMMHALSSREWGARDRR